MNADKNMRLLLSLPVFQAKPCFDKRPQYFKYKILNRKPLNKVVLEITLWNGSSLNCARAIKTGYATMAPKNKEPAKTERKVNAVRKANNP